MPKGLELESALLCDGHSHRQVDGHEGSGDGGDGGCGGGSGDDDEVDDENDEDEDLDRSVVECGQVSEFMLGGRHA